MTRDQVYSSSYCAGLVKRYHTWPMLREQTVAEHCWRVAGIYVEIFGLPRAEVLYFCLHHDSGELWSGDIPFKLKKHMPDLGAAMRQAEQAGLDKLKIKLPELTEEERIQVKIADLLEMFETGHHEWKMGNTYAEPIWQDTKEEAYKLAEPLHLDHTIFQWVRSKGG